MARKSIEEFIKVSIANSGLFPKGNPCMFNDVFNIEPIPAFASRV